MSSLALHLTRRSLAFETKLCNSRLSMKIAMLADAWSFANMMLLRNPCRARLRSHRIIQMMRRRTDQQKQGSARELWNRLGMQFWHLEKFPHSLLSEKAKLFECLYSLQIYY